MRPMFAIALALLLSSSIAAQSTEAQNKQIPGSNEFHFGRISSDGDRILEVVPVIKLTGVAEQYEVEIPYTVNVEIDGKVVVEERVRTETRTRVKTVPRTVLEKRNSRAVANRIRTLDGKAVTRYQLRTLKAFANRPVVMLHKPQQELPLFFRQAFAADTLICYPADKVQQSTGESPLEPSK